MAADVTVLGVLLGLVGGVGGTVLGEIFRLRRAAKEAPELYLDDVRELTPALVAGNPTAYARLDVGNVHGNGATGVTVRIERVDAPSPEHAEQLTFLAGWQLAWANEDRGNPNVPPQPKSVAAGDRRRVDLAHLNATVPGQAIIDVRPQPNNKLNYLGAGLFTFEIVVSGDNARARRYAVVVAHDGQPWDGDHATAVDRLQIQALREL